MNITNNKNKIDIIPNTFTTILCSNNVDKIKFSKTLKDDKTLLITTKANDLDYEFDSKLVSSLKIKYLFTYEFDTLSSGEKQLIQIAKALNANYNKLIIVDAISYISSPRKEKILKYLSKITNKTIIYITNNKEDIIYSNNFILFDNKVILNDKLKNILAKEKEFKMAGFELPFMPLLSLKLKYYNLVDKPILSMDRMVNKLWK